LAVGFAALTGFWGEGFVAALVGITFAGAVFAGAVFAGAPLSGAALTGAAFFSWFPRCSSLTYGLCFFGYFRCWLVYQSRVWFSRQLDAPLPPP